MECILKVRFMQFCKLTVTGNSMIGLGTTGDSTGSIAFKHIRDGNVLRISSPNASSQGGGLTLKGNSLGIGTDSPTAPLTIVEQSNVALKMLKSSGQTLFTIGEDGGNNVVLDSSTVDLCGNVVSSDLVIKGGNVGIGTNSPSRVLTINHVHPGIRFEDADGDPAHVTQVASYEGTLYFDSDMANPVNTEGRTSGKGFVFRTDANTSETPSGKELLVINQNGKVGIGTSDPSRVLDIDAKDSRSVLRLMSSASENHPHYLTFARHPNSKSISAIGAIQNVGDAYDADDNVGYEYGRISHHINNYSVGNATSETRIYNKKWYSHSTSPQESLKIGRDLAFTGDVTNEYILVENATHLLQVVKQLLIYQELKIGVKYK